MILSHRIFLAIMCDNHAMKKVLINLLFLRMNILLMILVFLILLGDTFSSISSSSLIGSSLFTPPT
jgi:hypothetical protein